MPKWLIFILERLDLMRHRARFRSLAPAKALGFRAEDLAHRFLQRQGYDVVARNWRPPAGHGEIDIVAFEGNTLVCVEVKARTSDGIAAPERAIGKVKRVALESAAISCAFQYRREPSAVRFDLVTVVMEGQPRIRLDRASSILRSRHAVC